MKEDSIVYMRSIVSSRLKQNKKTGPWHWGEIQMNWSMDALLVTYLVGKKVSINAHQVDRERNPPS